MDAAVALHRLGGSAEWSQLADVVSRQEINKALELRQIVRLRRGRYALWMHDDLAIAAAMGGVVSHLSAAWHWKLETIKPPFVTDVTLPRNRSRKNVYDRVRLHYAALGKDDIHQGAEPALGEALRTAAEIADHEAEGLVTTPLRTVLDCAKTAPLPVALAVGDSALRSGRVERKALDRAAGELRGWRAAQARQVISWLDERAMSGLESALRAILLGAGITHFEPQLEIRDGEQRLAAVDLGDAVTGILLEADSFTWHGRRGELVRDCRRYDELVVRGHLVLRFAWEQVIDSPRWVLEMVQRAVAVRRDAVR